MAVTTGGGANGRPPRSRARPFLCGWLSLSAAMVIGCSHAGPSDEEILKVFANHRADIETLVRMSNEDYARLRVIRVAPTFARVDGSSRPAAELGFLSERWDAYRKLFDRIGLRTGISRGGESWQDILIPVWSAGLGDNGKERGLMYSPGRVRQYDTAGETFTATQIDGFWHLYTWVTR